MCEYGLRHALGFVSMGIVLRLKMLNMLSGNLLTAVQIITQSFIRAGFLWDLFVCLQVKFQLFHCINLMFPPPQFLASWARRRA